MFTDLAGFTELAQRDEKRALELLREQHRIVEPILKLHHGRRVKEIGDGLLLEFPNALDAVECGVDIQRTLAQYRPATGSPALLMRVGIHLGDVESHGSDILGDAVNIASRVEPVADAGGVCVSEPVYVQVHNKVPYRFEPMGSRILEGIREPIALYRIALHGAVTSDATSESGAARIAVLPFVNMSPDPADGFFADGITEELIGRISQIEGARVIARTSVMPFKGSGRRVSEIARELHVTSLVEGSVRRSGNRLRMSAQLVNAQTEEPLWTSQYDRELSDVFDIQTEIATKVAGAVESHLYSGRPQTGTRNVSAYTTYLRALQLLHAGSDHTLREALQRFNQTLGTDEKFAEAQVGLAQAWLVLTQLGSEPWTSVEEKATPAAKRALELAPNLADAHAVMSEIHGMMDRHSEAVSEAQEAIRLNPNDAVAYRSMAISLGATGRLEESIAALRRAHELDPLSSRTIVVLAQVNQAAGHAKEAMELTRQAVDLYPDNPRVTFDAATIHFLRGDLDEADRILAQGLARSPGNPVFRGGQAIGLALRRDRGHAEAILTEIRSPAAANVVNVTELVVRSILGDVDLAFRSLDALAAAHSWPWLIRYQPFYESIRKDPRFRDFCRRVGIPE